MILALALTLTAAASPTGTPLEDVPALAEAAWDEGAGAAWVARVTAAREARRGVATGPVSVDVQLQAGHPAGNQLTGWLDLPLATGIARRAAWTARAEAAGAAGEAARIGYVEEVQATWTRWWWATVVDRHLTLWATDVERDLAALDAAAKAHLVAPLDVADLRAELGSIRAEAIVAEAEARSAEAEVEAMLGRDVALADVGDPETFTVPDVDPWPALVDRVRAHPDVVAAEAAHVAAAAEVRALTVDDAPTLSAGAMSLNANGGDPNLPVTYVPLAFVGLHVPLQHDSRATRRAAKGEAAATEVEATWTLARVTGGLQAEAEAFDATRERLDRLEAEVIDPLHERERLVADAFRQGLVPADRLVRARRDHHEAEHQRLSAFADLIASVARAHALARAMDRVAPEETR